MEASRPQVQPQRGVAHGTAVDLFNDRVAKSAARPALRHKEGGAWRTLTWKDWQEAAREIAAGLRTLGVEAGDRVVILSNTRVEWCLSDVGILFAGAATVPIYQSSLPDQCEYIINDCGAKVLLLENPHQLEKMLHPSVKDRLAGVRSFVLFSDVAELEKPDAKGRLTVKLDEVAPEGSLLRSRVTSFAELRADGRKWLGQHPDTLEQGWRRIDPESVFTIVYTSGTTGPPKGVILTHDNIVSECLSLLEILPIDEDDEQILVLPLAHIFAKLLEWVTVTKGSSMAFGESFAKLADNMKEVRPTFMCLVPRVYEKVFAKIQSNFAEKRKKAIARLLIDWAVGVGRRRSAAQQKGRKAGGMLAFQGGLADKLVFKKVKDIFGGRVRFFVSGGAPLSREIAEFFHAMGLLVLEGYGLTETTAATHVNRPEAFRFGTVGQALPRVEVMIAPDGEIMVRGRNIFRGYYNRPDATSEAIEADGWFHTGDVGVIEEGGFLRITDRKKDIIVTAGGKNVAPQNIENQLKVQTRHISQVVVVGDKKPYLVALVTLNEEVMAAWAKEQGISYGEITELSAKDQVRKFFQAEIDRLNGGLASWESIKRFEILPRDLSEEAGELTASLKVKRKFCMEKYGDLIEGMYRKGAVGSD